jgi:hypothetical protein
VPIPPHSDQHLTMHVLSDEQAQTLHGGFFQSRPRTGYNPIGHQGPKGLWLNTFLRFQTIFTNVNQVNVAINLALGGGTVINNQANILSINSSM